MSFAPTPTTPRTLATSASASSLQHNDELDTLMSCYMDETNMELDPEESFSPDTFWDDDKDTDKFDGKGGSAMEFLPSTSHVDSMHGSSTSSHTGFNTSDAFSSTLSFSCAPTNTSTYHDKEAIAQRLRVLDQRLAISMKRSEASRECILDFKRHRLANSKSSTNISTSTTFSSFGGNADNPVPKITVIPTASPNHSPRSSMPNNVVSKADRTAAVLIESRTSLTASLEQSCQQLNRFSTSALSA